MNFTDEEYENMLGLDEAELNELFEGASAEDVGVVLKGLDAYQERKRNALQGLAPSILEGSAPLLKLQTPAPQPATAKYLPDGGVPDAPASGDLPVGTEILKPRSIGEPATVSAPLPTPTAPARPAVPGWVDEVNKVSRDVGLISAGLGHASRPGQWLKENALDPTVGKAVDFARKGVRGYVAQKMLPEESAGWATNDPRFQEYIDTADAAVQAAELVPGMLIPAGPVAKMGQFAEGAVVRGGYALARKSPTLAKVLSRPLGEAARAPSRLVTESAQLAQAAVMGGVTGEVEAYLTRPGAAPGEGAAFGAVAGPALHTAFRAGGAVARKVKGWMERGREGSVEEAAKLIDDALLESVRQPPEARLDETDARAIADELDFHIEEMPIITSKTITPGPRPISYVSLEVVDGVPVARLVNAQASGEVHLMETVPLTPDATDALKKRLDAQGGVLVKKGASFPDKAPGLDELHAQLVSPQQRVLDIADALEKEFEEKILVKPRKAKKARAKKEKKAKPLLPASKRRAERRKQKAPYDPHATNPDLEDQSMVDLVGEARRRALKDVPMKAAPDQFTVHLRRDGSLTISPTPLANDVVAGRPWAFLPPKSEPIVPGDWVIVHTNQGPKLSLVKSIGKDGSVRIDAPTADELAQAVRKHPATSEWGVVGPGPAVPADAVQRFEGQRPRNDLRDISRDMPAELLETGEERLARLSQEYKAGMVMRDVESDIHAHQRRRLDAASTDYNPNQTVVEFERYAEGRNPQTGEPTVRVFKGSYSPNRGELLSTPSPQTAYSPLRLLRPRDGGAATGRENFEALRQNLRVKGTMPTGEPVMPGAAPAAPPPSAKSTLFPKTAAASESKSASSPPPPPTPEAPGPLVPIAKGSLVPPRPAVPALKPQHIHPEADEELQSIIDALGRINVSQSKRTLGQLFLQRGIRGPVAEAALKGQIQASGDISRASDDTLRALLKHFSVNGEKAQVWGELDRRLAKSFETGGPFDWKALENDFPELKELSLHARSKVENILAERDALNARLVQLGAAPDRFMQMAAESGLLDAYLTRSYLAFGMPAGKWLRKLMHKDMQSVLIKGVAQVREQLRAMPGLENASTGAILSAVMDTINGHGVDKIGASSHIHRAFKSLLARSNVHPDIKAMMGEVNSGFVRLANTIGTQRSLVARLEMMQEVAANPRWSSPVPVGDMVKELPDHYAMGHAKKRFVTPEVYEAIGNMPQAERGSHAFVHEVLGFMKGNQVALGGIGPVVNSTFGNLWSGTLAGGLDLTRPNESYNAFKQAWRAMKDYADDPSGQTGMGWLIVEARRVGADVYGFGSMEVGNPASRRWIKMVDEAFEDAGPEADLFTFWGRLNDKLHAAAVGAKKGYGLYRDAQAWAGAGLDWTDRLFRLQSYFALRSKFIADVHARGFKSQVYRRGLMDSIRDLDGNVLGAIDSTVEGSLTEAAARMLHIAQGNVPLQLPAGASGSLVAHGALDRAVLEGAARLAAHRVNLSFWNPHHIGPALDNLRRSGAGFISPYATAAFESMRLMGHIPARLRDEPELALRIGAAAGIVYAAHGANSLLQQYNGITPDEVEQASAMWTPRQKRHRMMYSLWWRNSEGRVQQIDISKMWDPLRAFEGLDEEMTGRDADDAFLHAAKRVVWNTATMPLGGGFLDDPAQDLGGAAGLIETRGAFREPMTGSRTMKLIEFLSKDMSLAPGAAIKMAQAARQSGALSGSGIPGIELTPKEERLSIEETIARALGSSHLGSVTTAELDSTGRASPSRVRAGMDLKGAKSALLREPHRIKWSGYTPEEVEAAAGQLREGAVRVQKRAEQMNRSGVFGKVPSAKK